MVRGLRKIPPLIFFTQEEENFPGEYVIKKEESLFNED